MSDGLISSLKKLRLSGLASTLDIRLHEAASSGLTHREFLERLLQDELLQRDERQMARRMKLACFREAKKLEDFDFSFNTTIKKNLDIDNDVSEPSFDCFAQLISSHLRNGVHSSRTVFVSVEISVWPST